MGRPSRRGEILEIGVDLLHRYGYTATSVDSITMAAGVPKGAFFNHFGSKEAFAVEALRRYCERWEEKVALVTENTNKSAIEKIRALISAASRSDDAAHGIGCMLGNLSGELGRDDGPVTQAIAAILLKWEMHFKRLIEDGQNAGELRAAMPAAQSGRLIVNGMQGALLRSKIDHNSTALKDLDLMLSFLLGIGPKH